jgi:myxalamid-type polyketide synthase MxaE and MxaD
VAAVRALEENGATIHIVKADAADRREMSELWNKLDANHPPVRGIVHAAGILWPCELVHLEPDEFHAVLRSKVNGASLLHEFGQATSCRADALDFFVLFSSGASVWGSQSMAHYAAANHFIDAMAQHRVALGLPGLSVNWGWWEGSGMVSEELAARFQSVGMKGLPADGALAALTYLLETGAAQKTVADMDWSVFRPIFEARRKRPLLESLAALTKEIEQVKVTEEKRHGLLYEMEQASAIEQKPLLHDYIRNQVAEILGFRSPDRVDPQQGFFRMGMDSIMTMQLRNRLETALGHSLPPTIAFEYPTVDSLVDFIAGMILKPEASDIQPAGAPEKQELSSVDAECEELSEEELVALLERRLEEVR